MKLSGSPDLKNWTKESSFGHGYGAEYGKSDCRYVD